MLKVSLFFNFFFRNPFSQKEKKKSDGIFGNLSFVEMKSSKLIIYSTNMC